MDENMKDTEIQETEMQDKPDETAEAAVSEPINTESEAPANEEAPGKETQTTEAEPDGNAEP